MEKGYELLCEKEGMWARMLMEVLEDNGIACTAIPVMGAGFSISTGMQDSLRVYVKNENLQEAAELLDALFSEDAVVEDDFS